MADPFLQEATHAPHPMHEEASMLSWAFSLEIRTVCASGALPVFTLTNPPACSILSKALRLTIRSLITGNAPLLKGSTVISLPSLKRLMYSWHVVTPSSGPCALPLIYNPQAPQIPSRQSWSNAIVSLFSSTNLLFRISSISGKEVSGSMSSTAKRSKYPFARGPA